MATTLGTICSAILFNVIIDPYGLYQLLPIPGINTKKIEAINNVKLRHALAVELTSPAIIIAGTSTALTGLDPENPAWGNRRVYNMGLPGANMYEIRRFIQHALSVAPVNRIVLGIDFFSLNALRPVRPDFNENQLAVNEERKQKWLSKLAILQTFLSTTTLSASFRTLKEQVSSEDIVLLRSGRLIRSMRRLLEMGQYKTFETEQASFLNEAYCPFSFSDRQLGEQSQIKELERILSYARARDVNVDLFFSPVHVTHLEAIRAAGLWGDFQRSKKIVAAIVENDRDTASRNIAKVTYWDFTAPHTFTSEQIPREDDHLTRMRWFWDSVHYDVQLGDRVVARILDRKEMEDPSFGVLLNSSNLALQEAALNHELDKWELAHPEEVKRIKALIDPNAVCRRALKNNSTAQRSLHGRRRAGAELVMIGHESI